MGLSMECITMLQHMNKPAIITDDTIIIHVNKEAKMIGLTENQPLNAVLKNLPGEKEILTKSINGISYAISAAAIGSYKLYILDQYPQQQQLLSLLRAAQHLRMPLGALTSSVSSITEQITDNETINIMQKATRQLYTLHRTVRNMSDVSELFNDRYRKLAYVNIFEFIREFCEKLSANFDGSNLKISYTIADEDLYCNVDTRLLERAIYNMISNSLKADSKNIQIDFKKSGKMLQLTVTDDGHGLSNDQKASILSKFKSEPTLNFEDRGLGLGMLIIHAAAIAHNGTVLFSDAQPKGCKVTLTMEFSKETPILRQTPDLISIDPLGGVDPLLIELSEFLPADVF